MRKLILLLKQTICRHHFEVVMRKDLFFNLSGRQLYKKCKKCGKVTPYRFISNEEEAFLIASIKDNGS